MSVRLALVSDSHLSARTPEASDNWRAMLDEFDRRQPDAVVHTGDISLDGAGDTADLHFARTELDAVGASLLSLPGNHDLGDNPCETNADYPSLIDSDRLASYCEIMGPDRWIQDLGNWRLLGCNAQLFNSGLPEEEAQWDWLEQELTASRFEGRFGALFTHKPLMHSLQASAEDDVPIRYVRPEQRTRFLELLERAGVRAIVSGHVHQHRMEVIGGMTHLWVPTTWATLPPAMQGLVGERWVGGLELELGETGSVSVTAVQPDGVGQHVIGETIPNPYGDH